MRCGRVTGIIALLLLTSALAVPVVAATTYTDPQQRFSFTVPDGYMPTTAQLTPPVVAGFVAPNPAGANFTVQVRDATQTLDAATTEFQKRYAMGADSQPGPNGITSLTLGGQPARQFDYFTNAQGSRFHILQVVAIDGKALYILIFTAQEGDYAALIGQTGSVVSSFTFLSAGANGPSAPISDGSAVYSDPQGRFSFTIPIDFQSVDPGDAALEFDAHALNGNLAAYFYMYVDNRESDTAPSFNADVASQRDFLITDRKYMILSEQAITLGGIPAYRFDVTKTFEDSGARVRSAVIFVYHGGVEYQFVFVTSPSRFDEYSGRLQALLSSFSFSATPNPVTPPSASPASPPKPTPPIPANPPPSAPPSSPPPTDSHDNGR
ncbi:MAG: PsbP-related protein [Thermomicrobiales bacterium]